MASACGHCSNACMRHRLLHSATRATNPNVPMNELAHAQLLWGLIPQDAQNLMHEAHYSMHEAPGRTGTASLWLHHLPCHLCEPSSLRSRYCICTSFVSGITHSLYSSATFSGSTL